MASIYDDIRRALEEQLASISGLPDIAWENVNFSPATDSSYLEARFEPTQRFPAVRGTNPQQYYSGIFLVNVFSPADLGPGEAEGYANTIIENFDATSDLTANGKTISIREARREGGFTQNAHYQIPVIIEWYIYD